MTLKQIILDILYDDHPNLHGQRDLYYGWAKYVDRPIFADGAGSVMDDLRDAIAELSNERAIMYVINRLAGTADLEPKKWMGYRLTMNQWLKMTRQKQKGGVGEESV